MNLSIQIIIQKMIGSKSILMNLIKNKSQDLLMKDLNFQISLKIRSQMKIKLGNIKEKHHELQIFYLKEDYISLLKWQTEIRKKERSNLKKEKLKILAFLALLKNKRKEKEK